jgi:hypothetical protein
VPPTPAPVPSAPAPGPSPPPPATVIDATLILELNNPTTVPYTLAQRQIIAQLIAQAIGATADPNLQGRRLLALEPVVVNLENVADCGEAATTLQAYISSGKFAADAAAKNVQIDSARIVSFVCNGAEIPLPLAPVPAPAPGRKMML